MGCTPPKKQQVDIPYKHANSSGILRITLNAALLTHSASVFKMSPYAIVKLSNQAFTSKTIAKADKYPVFGETFTFYINSYNQQYGRNLQITLMDKCDLGGDNFIGYGIVDMNPCITEKRTRDQFRCMLNFQNREAGFVNVLAEFTEELPETLHFRFEQATLRKSTSTLGSARCWVQVTIGEEVMQTGKQKDTKQKPPMWMNQILTFKVFRSIKQCVIRVMDDDNQIGKLSIETGRLLESIGDQIFIEDFHTQEGIKAGTLKFRTVKGKAPTFTDTKVSSLPSGSPMMPNAEPNMNIYYSAVSGNSQQVYENTPNPYTSQKLYMNPYGAS